MEERSLKINLALRSVVSERNEYLQQSCLGRNTDSLTTACFLVLLGKHLECANILSAEPYLSFLHDKHRLHVL